MRWLKYIVLCVFLILSPMADAQSKRVERKKHRKEKIYIPKEKTQPKKKVTQKEQTGGVIFFIIILMVITANDGIK